MDVRLRIDHLRTGPTEACLHEIGHTRNTGQQQHPIDRLPQEAAAVKPDTAGARHKEQPVQHPHFRGQPSVPLQRVFQSHANGRDQDQCQQCREGKAADHGDGKRRTDSPGILRVTHRHRKHGYDRRDGGNQDRTDTRQPRRHQRPVAAIPAPAENVGIVDQDNAVVDHHPQKDQEPDHHVRIVQQAIARQQQRQQRTDRRQRDGEQQDERRRQGLEHRGQYHKDQDKRR